MTRSNLANSQISKNPKKSKTLLGRDLDSVYYVIYQQYNIHILNSLLNKQKIF